MAPQPTMPMRTTSVRVNSGSAIRQHLAKEVLDSVFPARDFGSEERPHERRHSAQRALQAWCHPRRFSRPWPQPPGDVARSRRRRNGPTGGASSPVASRGGPALAPVLSTVGEAALLPETAESRRDAKARALDRSLLRGVAWTAAGK